MPLAFGLLAAGAALAAWVQDIFWVRGLFLWSAGSFGWVALAYVGLGTCLGKRPDGRMRLVSQLLLAPYHGLNALSLRLCRDPAWNEILPGLYLGRRLSRAQARELGPVAAVLDLTAELSECSAFVSSAIHYRLLPTLDKRPLQPLDLQAALEFVSSAPRPLYIHCALGHGRSASVVAAYLLSIGQVASAEQAEAFLRDKRPAVRLSKEQRQSIQKLEEPR